MNDEILTINDYPIGWGWLKDVPLIDWEWLIDVFATMTDNTDPIHTIQILSRALLPTKDPRRRENLLPTQK